MNDFNKELLEFLKTGTCAYTCIKKIKEILLANNYNELRENTSWNITPGKYFVIRNDASIIAFNIDPNYENAFNIICTHSDTPTFIIKPNPDYYENGYLKLSIAPYGGILNYGFMDRPLSIAGRLIIKNKNHLEKKIIDLKETVAVIPSLAIHQNDTANTNLDLNVHDDLIPIISLNKDSNLESLIKEKINLNPLEDFDLFLYNNEENYLINNEFILSPRIDNLTCTYASLKAFLNNFNSKINVFVAFNSEEIGSNTCEGADSDFLVDTLKRICCDLKLSSYETLANSFIISADNTHAKHPSHNEKSDYTNTPPLNGGLLIIRETNGTTTSITSSIFRFICEKLNLNWSYYTSRNDLSTGSTQAGASLKHLSINSLDIGLPMLAMHSSMELIGIKDTYLLYQAIQEFYQIKFSITENKIIFK